MELARSVRVPPQFSAPQDAHPRTSDSRAVAGERRVAAWLLGCCALVLAMIVLGGVTRLTHSGLSITEWQPLVGTLPPLSDSAWAETFARYQATPEYRQVNSGMSLAEFKGIFWWEYFHRLLGRAIGVVFLVPLLFFAVRGYLRRGLLAPLAFIFVLGGLQGALGWYMVQSGLVDNPRVSQLRLTAHLGLALLIFAAMFWLALSLLRLRSPDAASARGTGHEPATTRLQARDDGHRSAGLLAGARVVAALVFLQVLSGGLVAGLRAGFAYNTFPMMNGQWIPDGLGALEPWYRNVTSNLTTVQFDHRVIAALLSVAVTLFCLRAWRRPEAGVRRAATLVFGLLLVQVGLGIATLVLVVPLPLAAAHQATAVLLFAAALNAAHVLRARSPRLIAGRQAAGPSPP
jgi:cytochrome c oxidase assembly protein subunit 15